MAITKASRVVDLALSGHPPADIANMLGYADEDDVRTVLQDLNSAPSGQQRGAFTSGAFSGDLTVGGKFGANGVTAAALQAAYTQTFSTAARTVPVATAAAAATTGATNTTPYGFTTAAQADAIRAAVNATIVDVDALKKVVNALIDDLQAFGFAG